MSIPDDVRAQLEAMAKGRCEITGVKHHGSYDPHHRQQKSVGGADILSNLIVVVRRQHDKIHDDATKRPYHLGWLVQSWEAPGEIPVTLFHGTVLLDDDGGFRAV